MSAPFLCEVSLRNFRSIASCRARLGRLTTLVGPNGAGKSNFLDAFRFVRDSVARSPSAAVQKRGGFRSVVTHAAGRARSFAIRLDVTLPDGSKGHYAMEIGESGYCPVLREECRLVPAEGEPAGFIVVEGELREGSPDAIPDGVRGPLYLKKAAVVDEFRPLCEALASMGFYDPNPAAMHAKAADPGLLLADDGSNIAAVLREMARTDPQGRARIDEYLRVIVPGLDAIGLDGPRRQPQLVLLQDVGQKRPRTLPARNMSDGTVRILAVLVAAFQGRRSFQRRVPLVGIETPDAVLHPAAAEALGEALSNASRDVQVILTTHSPELLDRVAGDQILAFRTDRGRTKVAPITDAVRSLVGRDGCTAGELLRTGQMEPDSEDTDPRRDIFAT